MFCKNCGTEFPDGAKFCTNCGTNIEDVVKPEPTIQEENVFDKQPTEEQFDNQQTPIQDDTSATGGVSFNQKLLGVLTGPLFLAFCICISASTLIGIFNLSFDVIKILITIFSWLVFASAKNNKLDVINLRRISGTFFAHYVINFVVVGLFFLIGIFFFALSDVFYSILRNTEYYYEFREFAGILGGAIGIVLIIIAVAVFFINVFGTKKIHSFLQALYQSGEANTDNLRNVSSAKVWILIIGIASLFGGVSFLSNACLAASYILLYIMIKKFTE